MRDTGGREKGEQRGECSLTLSPSDRQRLLLENTRLICLTPNMNGRYQDQLVRDSAIYMKPREFPRIETRVCHPDCLTKKALLPPLGSSVMRNKTRATNLIIFCGADCWRLASQREVSLPGNTLVLPPGDHPNCYDWMPVEGLEPLIVWPEASREAVTELAKVLMDAGAVKVASTHVGVFLKRVSASLTCHIESRGPGRVV